MTDSETPRDDAQDDGSDNTTNTLSRDDIPETAHITACGDVISDDGEHIGEIESRGGVSSTDNPHPSDGENTDVTDLYENTVGYVSVEALAELRAGDGTEGSEE